MKKVIVKNLIVLSKRRNSISYLSTDKKWIYKFVLNAASNKEDNYKNNIALTNIITSFGIKTPKVGEIIEDENGNIGLEYEYLESKISLSHAVAEDPSKVEKYMKSLSDIGKRIHSISCDDARIVSINDLIEKDLIKRKNIYNGSRVRIVHKLMDMVEDTNTILHLDFQPGNYIMSKDDIYMIDIGSLCKGNEIYDLGVFYYLYHNISDEGAKRLSRCERDLSEKMWRSFVKYYYDFKTEKEIDDFNEYIKPYAILSAIAIDIYMPIESVVEYIDTNFEKIMEKVV